jgi:hypothetical protein
MTIKASGRSALILATGLFMCFAGPSQAATGADTSAAASSKSEGSKSAHTSRHWKKVAHRRSSKVAQKSATPAKADAADDDATADNSTVLPPSVANANAQLASADTPAGSAKAMTARANNILATPDNSANAQAPADTQVVSADQLNDVDRALHENTQLAQVMPNTATASADAPAAPVLASSNESSTWDQTSLIGKIFIAFGALLTMASAARMFMA